ncbi:MAG: hypothetical protein ACFHX7_25250 [Pseudomonadota bacterium]
MTSRCVAGFSRGISYAYALAGQREFDGLIALDGSFKQFRPAGFDRPLPWQNWPRPGSG